MLHSAKILFTRNTLFPTYVWRFAMLDNVPLIGLAAGMIKSHSQMQQSSQLFNLASHITFGSFTNGPKKGNVEPTYWFNPKTNTSINGVGLTNQGLQVFLDKDLLEIACEFRDEMAQFRISLAPLQMGDLMKMCGMLNRCVVINRIDEVEVNAACPNHRSEEGLHPVLAHDPEALDALMAEAEKLNLSKAIKIAPKMSEDMLDHVIRLCVKHGFGTIVSGNTLLGSSVIDDGQTKEQRLSVDKGGLAGAILHDIGVKQVAYLAPQCRKHGIKLIGCGGVLSAEVHKSYDEAGADETQLATGFAQHGVKIFQDIQIGLTEM